MRPAAPPAAAGAAAPASARNAAVTEDGRWAPDGDGDGESRSGEDGGDGDGENRCDEDGGDGDGESRCGEVRPKAPSAAAAGSGEMRPAAPSAAAAGAAEATKLVRSRLAGQTPPCVFTDSDWASIVEPCAKCAWQFLVHREFMAREVQDFEVQRLCVFASRRPRQQSWTPAPRTPALNRARGLAFRRGG